MQNSGWGDIVPRPPFCSILDPYSFLLQERAAAMVFDPSRNASWLDPALEGAKQALALGRLNATFDAGRVALPPKRPTAASAYASLNTSYVDALLRAFDASQMTTSHLAAGRLKAWLMAHNIDVARSFLRDTALFVSGGA